MIPLGARPIKRFLQKHLETMIARGIIAITIEHSTHITVDADESGFILNKIAKLFSFAILFLAICAIL